MKKSPHRMKHEQRKAIREAQKEEPQTEETEMKDKTQKNFVTSPKTNKRAKGKAASKRKSHQTSPDDVTWETEPESIHQEGAHWIKTIQKQTLVAAKRLRNKFLKKKK